MNRMDPRTNGRICKQCRPERSFGKRRRSEQMSQEPAQASFVERVPEAGPCSRIGERTLGALVSPPDGFPVLSQVVPALVRRVPSRSELAISCWKAHGWLMWAVHENDGSYVMRCAHTYCSQRWETTPLLPSATFVKSSNKNRSACRASLNCFSRFLLSSHLRNAALECRCIACAYPRSIRLPAFSRPLSRCSPLSSHPPVLRLWCADGSSARRTISVLSLHRQTRPA